MPRSGSGTYSLPPIYLATPGTTIQAQQHNDPLTDIASALTNSLASDGQTPMTGNLQMNSKKITGLAAGTAAADALRYDQVGAFLISASALSLVAGEYIYASGVNIAAKGTISADARTFLAAANFAAMRTTLGAQAADQDLTDIAAVARTRGAILRGGASAWEGLPLGAAGRHLVSDGTDLVYSAAMAYTDVTASRAVNTNYTNSGSRPLAVVINLTYTGANTTTQFQIGGVSFTNFSIGQGFTSGIAFAHSVIVPPGAVYRCNVSNGAATIVAWNEAAI